jgi:primosomal protein N'
MALCCLPRWRRSMDKPAIRRLHGRYRWQVMVKSTELAPMRAALAAMQTRLGAREGRAGVFVGIDIDPVNML